MKLLVGLGFICKIMLICLVVGLVVGLYLSTLR